MSAFQRMLNGSSNPEDLLACVFQLNDLEVQAYFSLLENPEARMEDIAQLLERDRSTAHRAVQRLVDLQLAHRQTQPLDGGGYCYTYHAAEPARVRERIEERLSLFEEAVEQRLERFHEEAQTRNGDEATTHAEARAKR